MPDPPAAAAPPGTTMKWLLAAAIFLQTAWIIALVTMAALLASS